ncbi:uncharacterized protein [Linepithema humile]|uniref:uncharacterized protein n=1 Tax=Linepithema humile TaxID=83485 RepID=UPI00351E21A0
MTLKIDFEVKFKVINGQRAKIDIFQHLSLKDENELEALESKLDNDVSYRNKMVKQLARITGREIKHSCLSVLRQIMSNEVAVLYSWHGAKKKEIF